MKEKLESAIDDIISDVEMIMTTVLIRAFKTQGCNPACHCCCNSINAGDKFKLAMITNNPYWDSKNKKPSDETEINDEMLCNNCTPDMLTADRAKELKDTMPQRYGGNASNGFTRKHKNIKNESKI